MGKAFLNFFSKSRIGSVSVVWEKLFAPYQHTFSSDLQINSGLRVIWSGSSLSWRTHAVFLKGFRHSMKDQATAHRGDEEPNDAGNRVNSHRTNAPNHLFGVGQAEVRDQHRSQNCRGDGEKGDNFKNGASYE
jgi:hypothetical protein